MLVDLHPAWRKHSVQNFYEVTDGVKSLTLTLRPRDCGSCRENIREFLLYHLHQTPSASIIGLNVVNLMYMTLIQQKNCN